MYNAKCIVHLCKLNAMDRYGNPFILKPYECRELFCGRESEVDTLVELLISGSDVTLFSPRRMGKTGLIMRTFEDIRDRYPDVMTFYVDIFSTRTIDDFNNKLMESVVVSLKKDTTLQKFFKFMSNLRPTLSFDPITSEPQVSLTYKDVQEKKMTTGMIFDFLKGLGKEMIIAIDEFQQIRQYPGVEMEAVLRSHIQHLNNIHFVFCGSRKHMMVEMFTDARRPFYESTSFLSLRQIPIDVYTSFINRQFERYGKHISEDAVEMILDWTRRHTFYTQKLCHTIFNIRHEYHDRNDVIFAINCIFDEYEDRFYELRNLVTPAQWNFLKAVAKEGKTDHPMAMDFLKKYNIGTPANAKRCLTSLLEKELLLAIPHKDGITYSVYNVFLSRWFESQ